MSIYLRATPLLFQSLTVAAGSRGLHLECYPLECKLFCDLLRFDQSDVSLATEQYFFLLFDVNIVNKFSSVEECLSLLSFAHRV